MLHLFEVGLVFGAGFSLGKYGWSKIELAVEALIAKIKSKL